jgi:quercetin dioxygenase-like cupin family protein
MLSAIELGAGNPSIATLLRISDALGVSLAALVDIERTSALVVNRNGTAPILWNGDLGGRALLVAGTEPPDVVELWEWILANGEVHRSEPHALGTRELLLVLEGTVELTVGAEQERLTVGDSAAFRSDVPHSYANPALPGSESSRFVMTVFEPRVGVPS